MIYSDISAKLNEITLKKNIPVHATLELTYRCPLKCIHCYITPQALSAKALSVFTDKISKLVEWEQSLHKRIHARETNQKELSTKQWKKILKQLADAGCLYLVFTGGEPFLREDLIELCKYATDLNFDIRIFTTGIIQAPGEKELSRNGRGNHRMVSNWSSSLEGVTRKYSSTIRKDYRIPDKRLKELKNTNVSMVEISFYGRKEIHNKVTRNPDSFDISLDFAKRLKYAGFRVKLKTPLMKENFTEINFIKNLSEENGFEYSFDPIIVPKNNGDKSNLKHRLSLRQLQDVFNSHKLLTYWRLHRPGTSAPHLISTEVSSDFFCGAGKNLVGINPYGDVYPCIQIPVSCGTLKENTFAEIWGNSQWLKKWRSMSLKDVQTCSTCSFSHRCNRCPGLALLEDENLFGPSSLACSLTKFTS